MAEFDRGDDGLAVRGSLDGDSEGKLRRHLQVLLGGDAETVSINLSKVDSISSICVGSLVAFWIDLRPSGRRMKVAPSPAVRKVLDMTGLSGVFAKAASVRKPPPAEEKPASKHADFDDGNADGEADGEDGPVDGGGPDDGDSGGGDG
ncbi:MAG: STAS domain-containing protein [Planctomycetota bacterium]|jgi:anti-anti-sigma factor